VAVFRDTEGYSAFTSFPHLLIVPRFGARSRLHTAKILRLSSDLPLVVEIVDTREKIEAFLPIIDGAIEEGLATLEKVEIRFYRGGSSGSKIDR